MNTYSNFGWSRITGHSNCNNITKILSEMCFITLLQPKSNKLLQSVTYHQHCWTCKCNFWVFCISSPTQSHAFIKIY